MSKYFTTKVPMLTIDDLINEEKVEREREWERKGKTWHKKSRKPKRTERNLSKVARRESRELVREYMNGGSLDQ